MPSRKKDDDVGEELRNIEGRLRTMEKASKSSSEDQLFFGISFSLLILFVTLPMSDTAVFLENVFGLSSFLAIPTASGIRILGIIFSLGASLARYYGSMCGEQKCKGMRFLSILLLTMGFEFFMFIIWQNILFGMTLNTGNRVATFSIGTLVLAVALCFVSYLEGRMFDFYASKGLVSRSLAQPWVSPVFAFLCFAIIVAQAFGIWMLSIDRNLADSIQLIVLYVSFPSFSILYFLIKSRTSHKRTRGTRTRPVQAKLSRW
jgi:hypothetical protein